MSVSQREYTASGGHHDVADRVCCFASFPTKTGDPSEEINTLSFTLCCLALFFGSSTSQLTTTLAALLHVLNNGGRELEEMASRGTGLSTYAADTI